MRCEQRFNDIETNRSTTDEILELSNVMNI